MNVKYYDELISLETVLIDLAGIKALAKAMAIASNQMPAIDREEALWKLADMLDDYDKLANETFYRMFEIIKNDKPKKGSKNGNTNSKI